MPPKRPRTTRIAIWYVLIPLTTLIVGYGLGRGTATGDLGRTGSPARPAGNAAPIGPGQTSVPSGPGATREQAVPAGQAAIGPLGLEATVVGYEADAWPAVKAQNQFNQSPGEGFRYSTVRLRVKNGGKGPGETAVKSSDFQIVGSSNRVFVPFTDRCGVIPDELNSALFPTGEATGNVCWKLPADEKDLVVIWEMAGHRADRRFLSVGQ